MMGENKMKLYLSVIGASMALISLVGIFFEIAPWYYVIISVVWCTALSFLFDGAVALGVSLLPSSLFGVENPHFRVSEFEMETYRRLRVRLWKDKIWELGGLGGFSKKTLKEPDNPEYIERFIIECNKGVLTHRLSYPLGFFAMLTLSAPLSYAVALPVAIVNLVLNVMPTMALRYNTVRLKGLYKRLKRKCGR